MFRRPVDPAWARAAPIAWVRLRKRLPWVCAAVLLPDGVAWLGRATSRLSAQARVRAALDVGGRLGSARVRGRVVAPELVAKADRWVHTAPVRGGWVRDPIAWRWSTARDLVGGVVDPYVYPRLRNSLAWGQTAHFDPQPCPRKPARPWVGPVDRFVHGVADACARALRGHVSHAPDPRRLAAALELRIAHGLDDDRLPVAWVDAAHRCWFDPRLRASVDLTKPRVHLPPPSLHRFESPPATPTHALHRSIGRAS